MDLGNDFLDMTPEAQATKSKLNKWGYIKVKSVCTVKRNDQQNEKTTYGMEKYLQTICLLRN